jgi:Tfp pilus assembly protein PilX
MLPTKTISGKAPTERGKARTKADEAKLSLRLARSACLSSCRNEKGLVLIAALALIAILALVATISVTTTYTDIKISSNYKTSVQSFYIAEAGVHRAIGMLNDATTDDWIGNLADTTDAFSGDNSFGNGTYQVEVEVEDDPTPGSVRINSTGSASTSSSTVETIVTKQYYDILLNYAMFDCGGLDLKEGETNIISGGDVYVNGTIDLEESGIQQIQGNVYATGDIVIGGTSSITGNAFANGNIDLESSASLNIDGNATAGGIVSGPVGWENKVSGSVSDGVSPDPVIDQCSGNNLADIIITSEDIQDFRDNPDTFKITHNYTFNSAHNYTGIVHITGNFKLEENATFSGNVIFIVDGNVEIKGSLTSSPPGSTVTFLVPTGNFKVKDGGTFTIDGTVLVGTVNQDGSGVTGGKIEVKNGSNLTVNGNVIAVNGDIDASSGGAFTINYQSPNDSNLIAPNNYTMTQWRQVGN